MMIRAEKNYLCRYSILVKVIVVVTALVVCFCEAIQNDNTRIQVEPKKGTDRNSNHKVLGLRQQRQEQFRQDERRLAGPSSSPSMSPPPMLYTFSPTLSIFPTLSPSPSKFRILVY
jgi:uncharacterized membrane protein (DUF106 family)